MKVTEAMADTLDALERRAQQMVDLNERVSKVTPNDRVPYIEAAAFYRGQVAAVEELRTFLPLCHDLEGG